MTELTELDETNLPCPDENCDRTFESMSGAKKHYYSQHMEISEDVLIEEIHVIADEFDTTPTCSMMEAHSIFSQATFRQYFGSWNDALEAAGFEIDTDEPTRTDVLEDMSRLEEELGRIPSSVDLQRDSEYTASVFKKEFGSWGDALSAYHTYRTDMSAASNKGPSTSEAGD